MLALGEGFSAERAQAAGLIYAVVGEDELEATVMDAANATGASRNTVKDHLRALTDQGHLTLHGAGRGTWYGLS